MLRRTEFKKMEANTQAAFAAVLKTLKNNSVMVETRKDGIYIRLAGREDAGQAFTLEWAKVYSFDERLRDVKSNTVMFAEKELEILSKSATDPNNRPIIEPFVPEILSLCEKFGKSGQSGGSAPYTASALSKAIKTLCLQEPICPITGIEDEWTNVAEYGDGKNENECVWQNKRCSAVFKNSEGKPYYLDAIVWKTQKGMGYSGSAYLKQGNIEIRYLSRQYIKAFPFTPKTFYIDIIEEEVAEGDWKFWIKNENQLKRVFKYYEQY